MIDTLDRFRGCLLGGAVGDALGGPIEFHHLETSVRAYGPRIDLGAFDAAAFTDDTQMTLFTAEGLIRATCAVVPRALLTSPMSCTTPICGGCTRRACRGIGRRDHSLTAAVARTAD